MVKVTKQIDARGSFCPGPLMELIKGIKKASVGDVIEVISTDSGSKVDIPEWVKKMGHEIANEREDGEDYYIAVRKMR
ncbi:MULTISPECIES: sulfurtransferase TusA family protein [unclassified Sporolactobacillus]|uniref:sulfurtransferase TusA family protein n=1 Tax=unclassified Sporolactobacillus TaxID=2628533 RepID=UPI002367C327|nr:sulfurtransferase TusA family protein [Sporolactobacillus sp. CQH2019]MDD9150264.1 sulfurtransferase TusA family protein [Sporolactobacillus sp. CQH2019]